MPYTVTIVFTKLGLVKYISHLDLLRLMGRSVRRAGLPFAISAGFSKHPKISITRALKLGIESESEEAVFALREQIPGEEFRKRLQAQLPEGIYIKKYLCQTKS